MGATLDGGCQCGEVRYRIHGEPLGLSVCHCLDCQRQSGSAFGMSLAVAEKDFELLAGSLRTFTLTSDSGNPKTCAFCPDCGVRIYHKGTEAVLSIKAGTVDDRTRFLPEAHYWTSRKQPWVVIPEEAPAYPRES